MLERLAELCREDATFEEHLRGCAFLSSGRQELRLVSELYDPAQSELAGLVDAEKEYPGPAFRREDVLGVLRRLGLRRSLDKDAVLRAADKISKCEEPTRKPSGIKLFSYLDSHVSLVDSFLSDEDALDSLRMIDWVPVEDAPPLSWLPVSSRNRVLGVAAPVVVRPVQDASLVSFSHALCSLTVKSEQLRRLLQWDIPPPSRLVAAQLMKMADVVNKLSPETNVTYNDVLSGQLQQSELDGWLSPFRSSVARLSVDVVREETRIKLALMQASVMFQCLTKHRVTPSDRPALPSSGWKPDGSRWRRSIMSLRRRRQSSSIPRYPRGLYHFVDGFQRL
jgi:hypothetical protein